MVPEEAERSATGKSPDVVELLEESTDRARNIVEQDQGESNEGGISITESGSDFNEEANHSESVRGRGVRPSSQPKLGEEKDIFFFLNLLEEGSTAERVRLLSNSWISFCHAMGTQNAIY